MRKGETFLCKIYVKNNQLRACPFTNCGPTEHQNRIVMRATTDINFLVMNNYNVTNFFQNAVRIGRFLEVIDCTDLLIFSDKPKPILNLMDIAGEELLTTLKEFDQYNNIDDRSHKNVISVIKEEEEFKPDLSDILMSDISCESDIINEQKNQVNAENDLNKNVDSEIVPEVIVATDLAIIRHVADRSIPFKEGYF